MLSVVKQQTYADNVSQEVAWPWPILKMSATVTPTRQSSSCTADSLTTHACICQECRKVSISTMLEFTMTSTTLLTWGQDTCLRQLHVARCHRLVSGGNSRLGFPMQWHTPSSGMYAWTLQILQQQRRSLLASLAAAQLQDVVTCWNSYCCMALPESSLWFWHSITQYLHLLILESFVEFLLLEKQKLLWQLYVLSTFAVL